MKQFDDMFRENVKKAFSKYNADHLADEGWNSFAGRKLTRHRRAAMIPVWARAASVVVMIGLGVLIAYRLSTRQITQESISLAESAVTNDEEPVIHNETMKEIPQVLSSVNELIKREEKIEKMTVERQHTYPGEDQMTGKVSMNNKDIINPGIAETRFLAPHYITVLPAAMTFKELRNGLKSDDLISRDLISEELKTIVETSDTEKPFRERSLMAGLSGLIAQSSKTASPTSGLSVGFYLDQKLTRKISVRPGLALAMQSFGIENGNNFAGVNYPLELYDGSNGTPYSFDGQLSMLAMELPLNFIFRLIEKERSDFYISAGASTMFYLSQQFTADFVNEYTKVNYDNMTGEYSSEIRYSTVEVEKDYSSFSRADFFGLANLSAGYSFPYSKSGTMVIEPFVQLPVSDLTSLNLRIRYGGISMKLRFGKQEQNK